MATTTPRQIDRLEASIQGFIDFFEGPFAKLNENPEGQGGASQVPSHGFLKRRRMSSVGLDD